MAQSRFGDRLTVLDQGHGAWLLQLRAAERATASAAPDLRVRRPLEY